MNVVKQPQPGCYIVNKSLLHLLKFLKIAIFVINLYKKDYDAYMLTNYFDQSRKHPRPILQDNKCAKTKTAKFQSRAVSRPRPRSRGLPKPSFWTTSLAYVSGK